jgi:hypothetical protein
MSIAPSSHNGAAVTRPAPWLDADIARFRRDGYLTFDRFVSSDVIGTLREVYDGMLSGAVPCAPTDRKLGGLTRQIMYPHLYHPLFRDNEALNAGRAVARIMLGCDEPAIALQMLIYKPPGHLADTPWHQDFGYAAMPFMQAGVKIPYDASVMFWLALDDVDVENGCMHFIEGGHLAPLHPHYVANGAPEDPGRLLAIRDPEKELDLAKVVACPLPAGGATMHSLGTPHYTPGNRTADRPRRAYIFNFSRPEQEHA